MPGGATRKVLVVAYFFPPIGGAGVQRVLKFVKYLPEHGFEPLVLSTRSTAYPAQDPSLLAELPNGTAIIRARDPAMLRWATIGFDYLGLEFMRGLSGWPDEAAAWIPAATSAAIRAVRRHQPAVIFSSGPPFSAHLVAWLTARATGVPWVAEFRDEFAANPHAEGRTRLIDRLSARVERLVLARAAQVVTVADYFVVYGVPATSTRRVTIVNGVDPADVAGPANSQGSERFRLTFVGTLYGDRDLTPVTSALRSLAARGEIDPACCELRIVGSMWLRGAPDSGTVPVVETGYVDHAEALVEMRAASVLLFYAPDSSPAPSGKIFEYLACQRPILCVAGGDNLAYRLVEDWKAGHSVEPSDGAGIEASIAEMYRRWTTGSLAAPDGARERVLERYSRRKLTGDLAAVLDEAAASGAPAADRPASPR